MVFISALSHTTTQIPKTSFHIYFQSLYQIVISSQWAGHDGMPQGRNKNFTNISEAINFFHFMCTFKGKSAGYVNYSMFHIIWTTFSSNRAHMGIISRDYGQYPSHVHTKWLYSVEIQCHKRFHLKSKAAINYTEILIFNEHNFQNYFALCIVYW